MLVPLFLIFMDSCNYFVTRKVNAGEAIIWFVLISQYFFRSVLWHLYDIVVRFFLLFNNMICQKTQAIFFSIIFLIFPMGAIRYSCPISEGFISKAFKLRDVRVETDRRVYMSRLTRLVILIKNMNIYIMGSETSPSLKTITIKMNLHRKRCNLILCCHKVCNL